MKYCSVLEIAQKWGVSGRSVRGYCAEGRIEGAFLTGKTWNIPENAEKPDRINKHTDTPKTLLEALRKEKNARQTGGIYQKIQVDLTYHSNKIENRHLTRNQIRQLFETNTLDTSEGEVSVDEIIEATNHFKCIDMIIDSANHAPSETFIKQLHTVLKGGSPRSCSAKTLSGIYKTEPNTAGSQKTVAPRYVGSEMKKLLAKYNSIENKDLETLLTFHYCFELIHPFPDKNGQIGRLLLFKECLRNNIVPFIIEEDIRMLYFRGLKEWQNEPDVLRNIIVFAQGKFKKEMDSFRVPYGE